MQKETTIKNVLPKMHQIYMRWTLPCPEFYQETFYLQWRILFFKNIFLLYVQLKIKFENLQLFFSEYIKYIFSRKNQHKVNENKSWEVQGLRVRSVYLCPKSQKKRNSTLHKICKIFISFEKFMPSYIWILFFQQEYSLLL